MSAERPTVLVDMDGVLVEFDGAVENALRENHPQIPIVYPRTTFKLTDEYRVHQDVIRSIHDAPGFFRNLEIRPDALYGWQQLINLGYQQESALRQSAPTLGLSKKNSIGLRSISLRSLEPGLLKLQL